MRRLLLFLCLLILFIGCTRTIYVPKETVKTEYRDRIQTDSVYMRDSIYIHKNGDTVFIYKDRYVYRDKLIRDTVSRVDSVSYPVIVEVEKRIKYIPKVYGWAFGFAIAVLGLGLVMILRKFKLF